MSVVATYRRLLGNGPLSRLLLGEFISSIGNHMYLVALLVLVFRESQDATVLAVVGAIRLVPLTWPRASRSGRPLRCRNR